MSGHKFYLPLSLFCLLALEAKNAAAASCPNLSILLDQSASMAKTPAGNTPLSGEKSKWDIAVAALSNIITKYDGLLPIGYSNFPYQDSSCDTRGFYVDTQYGRNCTVGYGTYNAIYEAMHYFPTGTPWMGGSTPTCTAVARLAAENPLKDPSRAQYILLVTDGAPEAACCGNTDPVKATVDAIAAAANQVPAVRTIVVGFGVVPSEHAALDAMAMAGGLPNSDSSHKFYLVSDGNSLDKTLSGILSSLIGGDAGAPVACEDGCYGNRCPSGQVCLKNQCTANLCNGKSCPMGQHCLFDGENGTCVFDCTGACPQGSRCVNGQCQIDPCGGPCAAGQMCNKLTAQCVPDPKCQNVLCHTTQGCFDGKCMDNPCVYTTCPEGTQCIDFTGQCMPPRPTDIPMDGCHCELRGHTHAAELGPLGALFALAMLGTLARRSMAGRRGRSTM